MAGILSLTSAITDVNSKVDSVYAVMQQSRQIPSIKITPATSSSQSSPQTSDIEIPIKDNEDTKYISVRIGHWLQSTLC